MRTATMMLQRTLTLLIVGWLAAGCYMLVQAEGQEQQPSTVSRAIWVYWDKNQNNIHDNSDTGLGGQLVYLVVMMCDPSDPNCVEGVEALDGYTEANGQALFGVPDNAWSVSGCYDGQGCLMSPGAIAFAVQGEQVALPVVMR